MTSRTVFFIVASLLILVIGAALLTSATRQQEPDQTFPATINRDCAPWDGSAFSLSISYEPGLIIYVSIWQSPDIELPVTFSFPDETGQSGFAYILPELDPLIQLTGEVFFWRVDQESPVEGKFDLLNESGKQFKGKFVAEWGDEVLYCG